MRGQISGSMYSSFARSQFEGRLINIVKGYRTARALADHGPSGESGRQASGPSGNP